MKKNRNSIAKKCMLTILCLMCFELTIDGDLFKAKVLLPIAE